MNKLLKQLLLFAVILAISISSFTFNASAADNTTLKLSRTHIPVGYTVKLTVTVSIKNMYATDLKIKYDKKALEYVSGASDGGAGTARIVEALSGEDKKSFTVTFKSLKKGTASLSVSGSVGTQSKNGAIAKDVSITSSSIKVKSHPCKTKSTTKATFSKDGKLIKKCTDCSKEISYTIKKLKTVSPSPSSYTYNGKTKKPTVTVKNSDGDKISSKYYTVTYPSGRKNVGKYKLTVKFKGNYSGTKTTYFKILPPKTTISKLTTGTKSIKVVITKKTTQVSGYQVQYSTSKTFSSYKTETLPGTGNTGIYLTSLANKKTYYIRVRTYKTVNGVKYYSPWSSYKSIKTL